MLGRGQARGSWPPHPVPDVQGEGLVTPIERMKRPVSGESCHRCKKRFVAGDTFITLVYSDTHARSYHGAPDTSCYKSLPDEKHTYREVVVGWVEDAGREVSTSMSCTVCKEKFSQGQWVKSTVLDDGTTAAVHAPRPYGVSDLCPAPLQWKTTYMTLVRQ